MSVHVQLGYMKLKYKLINEVSALSRQAQKLKKSLGIAFFSLGLNQLYRCEMNRSCKYAIVAHTLHTVIRMPVSIGLLLYKYLACRDVGPQHDIGVLSVCLQFAN